MYPSAFNLSPRGQQWAATGSAQGASAECIANGHMVIGDGLGVWAGIPVDPVKLLSHPKAYLRVPCGTGDKDFRKSFKSVPSLY